jgi:type 1 fimbria pilin
MRWSLALGLCSLALGACGGKGITVDLESVPLAKAGCEAPTMAQLQSDPLMLPGRDCQRCHVPSGQAASVRLTISGTVFRSLSSACNTGGASGVKVEILDAGGRVQATLTSNAAGNFYTSDPVTFPIRSRVTKDGVTREMLSMTAIGSCASCHQKEPKFGTEGIVYLNR